MRSENSGLSLHNKEHSLLVMIVKCCWTIFKFFLGTSEMEADLAKHKNRSKSEEKLLLPLVPCTLHLAPKSWVCHWYPFPCCYASGKLLLSAWGSTGIFAEWSKWKRQLVNNCNFSCIIILDVLLVIQLFSICSTVLRFFLYGTLIFIAFLMIMLSFN